MINQIIRLTLIPFSIFFISWTKPPINQSEPTKTTMMSRKEIHDYFSNKNNDLNEIEGLWSLGVIRDLYENGKRVTSESEPHMIGLAIIKDGGLFRVHDVNGAETDFIATFTETDESDTYAYQCYFTETNDTVNTTARFSNNSFLQYEYDSPQGVMMKYYYKPGTDNAEQVKKMIENNNLRLHWKFTWIKYKPSDSTHPQWQILNGWDSDFPTIAKPFRF